MLSGKRQEFDRLNHLKRGQLIHKALLTGQSFFRTADTESLQLAVSPGSRPSVKTQSRRTKTFCVPTNIQLLRGPAIIHHHWQRADNANALLAAPVTLFYLGTNLSCWNKTQKDWPTCDRHCFWTYESCFTVSRSVWFKFLLSFLYLKSKQKAKRLSWNTHQIGTQVPSSLQILSQLSAETPVCTAHGASFT